MMPTQRDIHTHHAQPRHHGVAMILVLIALTIATILSMSFLSSQATTHGIAQNVQSHAQARSVAESALVAAINYVQTDADVRTDKTHGQWITSASFNGGTFDLYGYDGLDTDGDGVVDDTDSDLSDDSSDPITLTVVGYFDGVSHTVHAVVTPGSDEDALNVLMIVGDADSLSSRDTAKKDLFESWGMNVTLISDDENKAAYDAAVVDAEADVAYVAESVSSGTVGTKTTDFTIGVVNDEPYMNDALEVSSSNGSSFSDNRIDIENNTHYITSTIDSGDMDNLTVNTSSETMYYVNGTLGSGATVLATRDSNSDPTIVAVEIGGTLEDSSSAAGRRVLLPWGSSFDMSSLNSTGQEIIKRSLEWAGEEVTAPTQVTFNGFEEAKRSSSSSSVTVSTPSGTVEGDLLIAAVATDGNESFSTPSGWTQISQANQGGASLAVYWKLASASESSSHTFSWGSNEEAYAWIMRFTGHHATTPIDTYATYGSGSSSSPDCPSVTTTVDNAMILRIGGFDDDDVDIDSSGLSGHTTITMDQSDSGSGTCSGGAGYVIQGTAGASGVAEFDLTNSEQYRTVTIAIAPDESAGGGGGGGDEPNLIALYEFAETPRSAPTMVGHWELDDAASGGGGGAVSSDGYIELDEDAVIDSYDSSQGAYGGSNKSSNAIITTNSTSSGDIDMEEDSRIKGDVYVGVGGTPSSVISGDGSVTGTETTLTTPVDMPNHGAPSGMPSSQGDKSINGTKSWTSDQTFDDLTFKSSAKLTVTGDITVWVKKSVEFKENSDLIISSGSTLTMYVKEDVEIKDDAQINADSSQPGALTIIQYQSGKSVKIEEDAVFAGTIDTESKLEIKDDATVYGSFRSGDKVLIGEDASVHLDVSTAGFMGGGGSVSATDEIAANDGTSSGTVTAESTGNGDGGTSVEFDGVDGYIEVAHDSSYLLDEGALSFWFNPDDTSGHQALVSKDSNGYDDGGHLHIYLDDSTLKVRLQSDSSSYTVQQSGISAGSWYHVVVSWGPGGLRLHLDGVQEDTDAYNGGLGTSSGGTGNEEPLVFGAGTWNSDDLLATPTNKYFDGRIDDVRIYDQGFNQTQANNVYNGSDPGPGDATTVYDTSGYGAALDLGIEDLLNVTWESGGGLTLNSETRIVSDTAASKLHAALTATDQFSIEVQFTPANTSQSGPARMVNYAGGTSDINVMFGQDGDAFVSRLNTADTTSSGTPEADSGSALSAGTPEHVIISYDGTNLTMYRDGASSVSLARTGDLDWDSAFNFMLGNGASDGYGWLGTLHRVAIYDQGFNSGQASNVFGGGDPGDGSGSGGTGAGGVDWIEP